MKHKTLVVVDSEKDLAQAKIEEQKGELCIVSTGNISWGKNVRLVEDYANQKKIFDVREEAMKWMKIWPGIKIDGKNFKELVSYDNTSLWWYAEFWFCNAHSSYDNSILDIFQSIETADRILNKEKPDDVISVGESLLCSIIHLVAKSREIKTSMVQTKNFSRYFDKNVRPILVKQFKKLKGFLRKTSKRELLQKTPEKIKILMFTHPTYRQATIYPETGRNIVEDTIISPVMGEMKDCDIVVVDTDPFASLRLDFIFNSPGYNHLESYTNTLIEEKISKEEKLLKEKWKSIKPFLEKVLMYKSIELMPLLEQKFSEMFCRYFVDAVKYIELSKEAVRVERPDVLVILDECGLYGKAAIFAGKNAGLPTVAIQHGVLGESNIDLLRTAEELADGLTPSYNPTPDKTLVSGEYYKTLLTDFGHSEDSIVPLGQPKYDILAKADKIFNKERIRKTFGIKPHEKMLLLASQPFPNEENKTFFKSLFKAVKKIPKIKLVIKLHPNEYDSSLHKNTAKEAGVDVAIIKDINTLELLYACDALITVSSTVALEAMILGKPVLIANLAGKPAQVPYVESGAAVGVYKDSDMIPIIKKVLFGNETMKKLEEPRKKFVFDHACKIDGMAARRIADVIRNMVRCV